MLAANYVEHCKVLGKLCRLWDDASADAEAMKLLISRLIDQYADGELATWDTLQLLNPYTASLASGVNNGAAALKALAQTMAAAYLTSAIFRGDLTTTPDNISSATSVLEALQTEMGAGVDNVTFTTKSSTGLVNFFDLFEPTGAWNTAADGEADYPDSTYVVITNVE